MKTLNLLIVEDSEDDEMLLLRHLKEADYDVQSERAQTAETFMEALAHRKWDIIISDYRMPNFTGLEALELLKKESGLDIPFIIISGTIGEETAVQAMRAGISDYMMKDNLNRLVPAIERELRESAHREARRQAEKALRESEWRLKLALRAARMGVWEWNLQSDHLFWSPECYEILGVDNFGGKLSDVERLMHPDDVERVVETIRRAILEHTLYDTEFRFIRGDGKVIWVSNQGTVDYSEGGLPLKMVGTVMDITERKRVEEALRESEERYRLLFENNPFPMWVYDLETLQFLAVNDAAIAQYEYTLEEFLSMTILDIRPQEDVTALLENISKTRNYIDPADIWRHQKKDGTIIEVEVSSHELMFDGKRARLVLANDVTERRRAEEELRKSEEQLRQVQKLESVGRLAGGIAHDFNNMLTAINGYSDLTLRRLSQDDPLRNNIEEIKKAGERSAELTRQLLAFSRRQILQTRVLDINQVISDTVVMLKRLIGEDIHLVSSLNPDAGQVKADPSQLSQVLMNLVVNSRDAIPQGGTIMIETRSVYLDENYASKHISVKPGRYVLLAISDNGTGISPEIMEHIFEPFFTTKEIGKGTGLGLSTVYGIVKQTGGNIWVYSEVGKGTTFKIYLPQVTETTESVQNHAASLDFQQGAETILLVEDEDIVRKLTREMLETCGYTVIEANNGIEALKICVDQPKIDLLLTDVVMPQMGGRELAEKLGQLYPQMRVLFSSGYTDAAIIQNGLIDPNTNFIQKPFTFNNLSQKVREVLDS